MEEINFSDLLDHFKSRLYLVVLFALLFGTAGYWYSEYVQVPKYESSITILLTKSTEESSGEITQNDIMLNQKLVTTYREIIKSNKIMNNVITDLNLNLSTSQLSSSVTVDSVKDTEIIRITVTNKRSYLASTIANKIADVFSKEIVELYKIQNIGIIDIAVPADEPYNINTTKMTVLSTAGGIALACAIIFTSYYFDTTIKTTEQLERTLELPVIGSIPKKSRKKKVK